MPVVINEFEVVSEAPPQQGAATTSAPAAQAWKPQLEPARLQLSLRKLQQQELRVWAH